MISIFSKDIDKEGCYTSKLNGYGVHPSLVLVSIIQMVLNYQS